MKRAEGKKLPNKELTLSLTDTRNFVIQSRIINIKSINIGSKFSSLDNC